MWIATVIFSLAICAGLVALAVPQITQIPYMLYMNMKEVTQFEEIGDELHMHNVINSKTLKQFEKIMAENPHITTLVEHIVPGSIDDDTMIPLSYRVRELGMKTKLLANSSIASGGTDLFLAGAVRIIELKEDGKYPEIGVHSWSNGLKQASDFPKDVPEHQQNRKHIEHMLGSDDFYWFTIYAAPADDIHNMTGAKIQKYNVATKIVPFGTFMKKLEV